MGAESAKTKVREHVILELEELHAERRLAKVAWRGCSSSRRRFNIIVAFMVTNHFTGPVQREGEAVRLNVTKNLCRLSPPFNH